MDVKRMRPTVTYVYDSKLATYTDKIPNIRGRAKLVHDLIQAYGLAKHMKWIRSDPATFEDLKVFHSSTYVGFLAAFNNNDSRKIDETTAKEDRLHCDSDSSDEDDVDLESPEFQNEFELTHEDFGFNSDCPLFKNLGEFACGIAGGTLTACRALLSGSKLAINWCGGWHHAHRDEARGFCTVNDIVLGCHVLQKKFPKILYIDLDAHHGDGVESAFSSTQSVLTFSLHTRETGFYPGSGDVSDVGIGRGKYYTVNAPLRSSVTDEQFAFVFVEVLNCIEKAFAADAVVVQCGADSLSGDPLGSGNLTGKGLGACVSKILELNLPTLFLGGGGYNRINTAKCWAYLTSIIASVPIATDIPEHSNFLLYGPDYDLEISTSPRQSANSPEYLKEVVCKIKENLSSISSTAKNSNKSESDDQRKRFR